MAQRAHLLKISVSGIRGVVGGFMTPQLAAAFAQAFGTYVGRGRVVVGRDTRSSGEMLQHAAHCGLLAAGCEVVDVGVQPTPTIQIFTGHTGARGGLALTASHNPPEYNALKLFNAQGLFFNSYERGDLIDLFHQSEFAQAANTEIRSIRRDVDGPPRLHLERILRHVDRGRIRSRRFRVGLDAVNGAGSRLSVHFLREVLGCDLRAIAIDPTLPFPRVAEPRPETLGELSELVRRERCDIGFAQDPDADRLAVADEQGRILDNDDVLALVTGAALEAVPGDVVVNLTTSTSIDDIALAHGRRVFRTPVGEANVVERMLAVKAAVGGEGSGGGVIFPAVHLCRDSYTAMALLLGQLERSGETISSHVAKLPRYYRRHGKTGFEHGRLAALMRALEDDFEEAGVDRSDGLKLMFSDAWIHVRASNTEPILRLAAEAKSESRVDDLYRRVLALLESP